MLVTHLFLATACLLSQSLGSALPDQKRTHVQERTDTEQGPSAVRTTSGHYVGHCSAQQLGVTEYLGIRYAQPPIGNLRFAAPLAFTSNDTFVASVQPDDCPYVARHWGSIPGEPYSHAPRIMAQESADGYNTMREDCLKMNIWTPSDYQTKKPVMVFIYGGGMSHAIPCMATSSSRAEHHTRFRTWIHQQPSVQRSSNGGKAECRCGELQVGLSQLATRAGLSIAVSGSTYSVFRTLLEQTAM